MRPLACVRFPPKNLGGPTPRLSLLIEYGGMRLCSPSKRDISLKSFGQMWP